MNINEVNHQVKNTLQLLIQAEGGKDIKQELLFSLLIIFYECGGTHRDILNSLLESEGPSLIPEAERFYTLVKASQY